MLQAIKAFLSIFSHVASYILNKQQQDAGRALANEDAVKEAKERADEANKIKRDSSTRTDNFSL